MQFPVTVDRLIRIEERFAFVADRALMRFPDEFIIDDQIHLRSVEAPDIGYRGQRAHITERSAVFLPVKACQILVDGFYHDILIDGSKGREGIVPDQVDLGLRPPHEHHRLPIIQRPLDGAVCFTGSSSADDEFEDVRIFHNVIEIDIACFCVHFISPPYISIILDVLSI